MERRDGAIGILVGQLILSLESNALRVFAFTSVIFLLKRPSLPRAIHSSSSLSGDLQRVTATPAVYRVVLGGWSFLPLDLQCPK